MVKTIVDYTSKTFKLHYIYHSCFLIEADKCNVIIDYYAENDEMDMSINSFPEFSKVLDKEKPLYVLVSHHHKDHFNSCIFKWKSLFKKVHYLLSYDVAKTIRYIFNPKSTYAGRLRVDQSIIHILSPGDEYSDENLKVNAFGSSDIGCSYLITLSSGENFFHAGDLNDWTFKNESTLNEINEAESLFHNVLDDMRNTLGKNFNINTVLFPLDPRLGCSINDGADQFLSEFCVDEFIPMHFAPSVSESNPEHTKNTELLKIAIEMLRLLHPATYFNNL